MDLLIPLVVIAAAYALFSFTLQRRLSNSIRTIELQERMKTKIGEYKQKMKENALEHELKAVQNEFMAIQTELMQHQMKPLLILLPISLVLLYAITNYLLPMIAQNQKTVSLFSLTLSYNYAFVLVTAIIGISVAQIVMHFDKKRFKASQASSANANTNT